MLQTDVDHFVAHGATQVVGKPLRVNTMDQLLKEIAAACRASDSSGVAGVAGSS